MNSALRILSLSILVVTCLVAASARIAPYWKLSVAQVFVVGEAIELKTLGPVSAEKSHGFPVLQQQATFRVLRVFAEPGYTPPAVDSTITIGYLADDEAKWRGGINLPEFPRFIQGKCFGLFLHQSTDNKGWELICEEDWGCIYIPCVKQTFPPAPVASMQDSHIREITGIFAFGTYEDMFRAGIRGGAFPDIKLLEKTIGNDEQRWFDIAVATYAASHYPRSTLAEIRNGQGKYYSGLTRAALRHCTAPDFDDRFIEATLQRATVHPSGSASIISQNYAQHPTALRLLKKMLDQDNSAGLYLACGVVRDSVHPLAPATIAAAKRLLAREEVVGTLDYWNYMLVTELIFKLGSKEDFSFLLKQIRLALPAGERKLYMILEGTYVNDKRAIEVCRLLINSKELYGSSRYCDWAASRLESLSGVDLGCKHRITLAGYDAAVEKAKEWFANHPAE